MCRLVQKLPDLWLQRWGRVSSCLSLTMSQTRRKYSVSMTGNMFDPLFLTLSYSDMVFLCLLFAVWQAVAQDQNSWLTCHVHCPRMTANCRREGFGPAGLPHCQLAGQRPGLGTPAPAQGSTASASAGCRTLHALLHPTLQGWLLPQTLGAKSTCTQLCRKEKKTYTVRRNNGSR